MLRDAFARQVLFSPGQLSISCCLFPLFNDTWVRTHGKEKSGKPVFSMAFQLARILSCQSFGSDSENHCRVSTPLSNPWRSELELPCPCYQPGLRSDLKKVINKGPRSSLSWKRSGALEIESMWTASTFTGRKRLSAFEIRGHGLIAALRGESDTDHMSYPKLAPPEQAGKPCPCLAQASHEISLCRL